MPDPSRGPPPSRKQLLGRDVMMPALVVILFVGLVVSLSYEPEPPEGYVHTHHSYRLYVEDEHIRFPPFNYAHRDPGVHMHEDDPVEEKRPDELLHIHIQERTFGDFLESLGLNVTPGMVQLDDLTGSPRAVHQGEVFEDNATHAWRFYLQQEDGPWERVPGDPVDFVSHTFEYAERLLLTYVPRDLPDDDPLILAQQESVLGELDRWPQVIHEPTE